MAERVGFEPTIKDKDNLADGAYDYVQVFDDRSDQNDFVLDSVFAVVTQNPVDAAFVVIDYGGKFIKKAASIVKNTATKTGKFLKKSVKAEATYANALIKSQRLDQKISESSIQKAKKGSYYSMIYIELEQN